MKILHILKQELHILKVEGGDVRQLAHKARGQSGHGQNGQNQISTMRFY